MYWRSVRSTGIRIFFLKFATFSFQIQKFPCPHVGKSNSPVHTHASDGIRIHSRETRPIRCASILAYFTVRDWARFNYACGFKSKYPDSPSTCRIRCGFFSVPLWGAPDQKISGFAAEFAGCVWTEAASGKKKVVDLTNIGYV